MIVNMVATPCFPRTTYVHMDILINASDVTEVAEPVWKYPDD